MPFHDWKDAQSAASWDARGAQSHPTRTEQLDILLSIMADAYQPGKWVLDLGFGSGLVEELLFQRIPAAQVVGVDMSREMIALAEQRLTPYTGQLQVVEHDLKQIASLRLPDHPYQFVIAVQSLHHLLPDEMQATYRFIHRTLEPGGLFLLSDRIRVHPPELWSVFQSVWARQDRVYESDRVNHEGTTFADHEQIVRERGDLPVTLEEHLLWLREAGFVPACVHLHANRALIAARAI